MNTSLPPIASRSLDAITPDGERVQISLLIGQPQEVTPEQWGIAVSLQGLHEIPGDIYGMDSWQAVQLAFEMVVLLLNAFVQKGGRLFWSGTDDQFAPVALLPQHRAPA